MRIENFLDREKSPKTPKTPKKSSPISWADHIESTRNTPAKNANHGEYNKTKSNDAPTIGHWVSNQ